MHMSLLTCGNIMHNKRPFAQQYIRANHKMHVDVYGCLSLKVCKFVYLHISGLTSVCNPRNHSCTCVATAETCSGNDVTSCHMTCNAQEKLICDHGVCSCKPLDYCDHDNTHCANLVCRAGSYEVPLCYANRCQCGWIVDKCLGNDTNTCQHLHCDGQFPHKACINGECGCQLNPCE